jgi:RHS repeat-associated protein
MYDSPQVEREHIHRLHQREGVLSCSKARYYNPSVGRFVSEDSLGFAVWYNFYAYAGNNSVHYRDPSGLESGPSWPPDMPDVPPMESIRPSGQCCNKNEIILMMHTREYYISQMNDGTAPSDAPAHHIGEEIFPGGWIMSVSEDYDCDQTGQCTLKFPSGFNPKINPAWHDFLNDNPCIRYCARLHEWVHYNDKRTFSTTWGPGNVERFIEFPAYMLELNCLSNFL